MNARSERRRWFHENWPRWESFARFKRHDKPEFRGRPWRHAEPRSKAELVGWIDAVLKDLETMP